MAKLESSPVSPIEHAPKSELTAFINLSRAELIEHALNHQIPYKITTLDEETGETTRAFARDGDGNLLVKPQVERTNRIEVIDGVETIVPGPILFNPEFNSRSTSAKHYVVTENTEGKFWEKINKPMSQEHFGELRGAMQGHLQEGKQYVVDVALGADVNEADSKAGRSVRQKVRFVTNSPVHALFASLLYRDLTPEELAETQKPDYKPDLTIQHAPDFKADPQKHGTVGEQVISFNYDEREIIIGGTDYLGEIKKAGFTWMHYVVDEVNERNNDRENPFKAFVTHASAVQKKDGNVAVLFGGSGAGKSSAPPEVTPEKMAEGYMVLYDDEGVISISVDSNTGEVTSKSVQIEGGAYVTLTNTHNEKNLQNLVARDDILLESVAIDPVTKIPDFKNTVKTTNIRAAAHITPETFSTFKESGVSGPVKDFVFLVPDTRGILPPVAKFKNQYQTLLYALVGPGSKIPGREQGVNLIQENFAPLQDEPFLPFHPTKSIDSLLQIMDTNDVNGWIVSSGWKGGPVGESERMDVTETQAAVSAILDGVMGDNAEDFVEDPIFGWKVHRDFLKANVWEDQAAYDKSRREYAQAIIDYVHATYPLDSHPEMAHIYEALPVLPAAETTVFDARAHAQTV